MDPRQGRTQGVYKGIYTPNYHAFLLQMDIFLTDIIALLIASPTLYVAVAPPRHLKLRRKQKCIMPCSLLNSIQLARIRSPFYSAPQCSHCKRCTSYDNSVCLSVRPSVTRRYCVKTTERITVQFALLDSKMCLVL